MRRLALVVGDTPGHFFPALAIATAYKRRRSDVEIVFFGPPNRGAELAASNGWQYWPVTCRQMARVSFAARSRAALQTFTGVREARRALRILKTQMVIGFGAYPSGAVVLAGKTLGLRTAINEGNVRAGLANRLLARFVDRIYLARAAAGAFPVHRTCVTGWPIRPEIAALSARDRKWNDTGRLRILVCSGSRGGAFFTHNMPMLIGELSARGFAVSAWHQCADAAPEPIAHAYSSAGIDARVESFIEDMAAAYQWADFAVARAGAGTLAELAAAALPSLIIPLSDAAEDHQSWNARTFAAAGAGLWMIESEWDSRKAVEHISRIAGDPEQWAAVSAAGRRLAVPFAADTIVDDCEQALSRKV